MTERWEPGIIIIDKSNNTHKSTIVRTDSGRTLRRKSRFLKKQNQCLNKKKIFVIIKIIKISNLQWLQGLKLIKIWLLSLKGILFIKK